MKLTVCSILLFLCPVSQSFAADYGVGIDLRDNDRTLYLPIDISEEFRIEPTFRYSVEQNNEQDHEFDSTSISLGVGVFGKKQVASAVQPYYGGRFVYEYSEFDYQFTGSSASEESSHTLKIIPVVGVEYFFVEQIALTGEIGMRFQFAELDFDGNGSNDDGDAWSSATHSSLQIRYYF